MTGDRSVNRGGPERRVWKYDRSRIRAPKHRIKEWDYYLVNNDHFGAAFTISDMGYIGLLSVSLLDFDKAEHHTETVLVPMPRDVFSLGASGQGMPNFRMTDS